MAQASWFSVNSGSLSDLVVWPFDLNTESRVCESYGWEFVGLKYDNYVSTNLSRARERRGDAEGASAAVCDRRRYCRRRSKDHDRHTRRYVDFSARTRSAQICRAAIWRAFNGVWPCRRLRQRRWARRR